MSNQFDMKIFVDDIAFSVVFTTVFTCRRSEILDLTKKSPKISFSTNNTFHLIIMMISVLLCKFYEEINYVPIFHNHVVRIWLRNRPAKLSWNCNKKIVATDVMLGIYSLIWTICHKVMWFYGNAVSFHIIFVVTLGEIFSHLGHTGPLTVNKMVQPSMYRRIWRHIHVFIGRNTIALRVQRFAVGTNIICLAYATDWWAVIGPVIHGESKSQATRSSSDPNCTVHAGSLAHVGLLR